MSRRANTGTSEHYFYDSTNEEGIYRGVRSQFQWATDDAREFLENEQRRRSSTSEVIRNWSDRPYYDIRDFPEIEITYSGLEELMNRNHRQGTDGLGQRMLQNTLFDASYQNTIMVKGEAEKSFYEKETLMNRAKDLMFKCGMEGLSRKEFKMADITLSRDIRESEMELSINLKQDDEDTGEFEGIIAIVLPSFLDFSFLYADKELQNIYYFSENDGVCYISINQAGTWMRDEFAYGALSRINYAVIPVKPMESALIELSDKSPYDMVFQALLKIGMKMVVSLVAPTEKEFKQTMITPPPL